MQDLIIITDIGSTTTKALLLKKVEKNYRIAALVHAPTTVEFPSEDVYIGIKNAIEKLQTKAEIKLLADDPRDFLLPGIDYLCTSSAGGGLQILVIGLTTFDSAASAKRCAFGAGAVILDTFAVNDKRSTVQQMKAMAMLHPDIILMTGGTDGGAVAPVLRLAELIQFANPRAKFTDNKIPLIFAGNTQARQLISGILDKRFDLHLVDNVRPALNRENPKPARDLIHKLFMNYVMQQAPGYTQVLDLVEHDIIPTPKAVLNSIELLHKNLHKDVMMVDIGGATTDVFSNLKGKFYRTVSANYGMSYSIANVLKDAGFDFVTHYLPADADLDNVADYIADKMLYPTCNPEEEQLIYLEHIMARAALFLARQQHLDMNFNTSQLGFLDKITLNKNIENMVDKLYFLDEKKKEKFFLHDYEYAIGAGGVIAHTSNPVQALMLIADGLQTQGITLILRDKDFVSPHLGKLSEIAGEEASQLLMNDCLQQLGWHIRPQTNKWKPAKKVMTISYDNKVLQVYTGKRYFIPAADSKRKYHFTLNRNFALNSVDTDLELSTSLPLYIDTTFPDAPNDIAAIRKHYNLADNDFKLNSVFPLSSPNSKIEQGSFTRSIRLPYLGEINLEQNDKVAPGDIVAQNLSEPPRLYIISLFGKSMQGLNKDNFRESLQIKENDIVKMGQKIVIRKNQSMKEKMYGYAEHFCSPVRGIVENINYDSGTIIMHEVQDYSDKPVKVKISERLGVKPAHIKGYLKVREGDFVYTGDLLAAVRLDRSNKTQTVMADKMSADRFAGSVDDRVDSANYNSILSPATGTIKDIDTNKGTLTVHYDRKPLLHYAGINGSVSKVIDQRQVDVAYLGWKMQGIIGFGREAFGSLVYCPDINDIPTPTDPSILIVKQQIDYEFLKKVADAGYKGLVAPSIHYHQLKRFTGEDIGVALTGNEDIPFPLVITQGFGNFDLPMEYQDFFAANQGKHTFIDGHTQIRAGVIRPQIIIQ